MPAVAARAGPDNFEPERIGRAESDGHRYVGYRSVRNKLSLSVAFFDRNSAFSKPVSRRRQSHSLWNKIPFRKFIRRAAKRYQHKENEWKSGHTVNTLSPRIFLTCGEKREEI
jgi:hypothetical protein